MRRRDLILGFAGALAASRLVRAQPVMPVIGFLHSQAPDAFTASLAAFHRGLDEAGYVEGKNVAIEYRWAANDLGRLPALAADLVARKVAVIAALGGPITALAAKAATATIPIVFNSGTDPIAGGLVQSLNRPGGNLTGVTFWIDETLGKCVEFMRAVMPGAPIAVMINPQGADAAAERRDIAALDKGGRQLIVLEASTDAELAAAITAAGARGAALVLAGDPFFADKRIELSDLAGQHRVAVSSTGGRVNDGYLLTYGPLLSEAYRQVGTMVGKILKGATPADLPVQRVDKFELVINLKVAKALGLTVPALLLAQADEVIE